MADKVSTLPPSIQRALREIAANVVIWRKLQGLTQAQLADRAGIGPRTLRRLEDGDGGTTLENVLRVLRALGMLEAVVRTIDPYESDVGRLRSDERLPQRVRPRRLTKTDGE